MRYSIRAPSMSRKPWSRSGAMIAYIIVIAGLVPAISIRKARASLVGITGDSRLRRGPVMTLLDPQISMLHVRRGGELLRRASPHHAPALDEIMPVGDARERLD